jgi:hypothetical protein
MRIHDQPEPITGAALVADEIAAAVLVIEPESILAATRRARTVLVREVLFVDPGGDQYLAPSLGAKCCMYRMRV